MGIGSSGASSGGGGSSVVVCLACSQMPSNERCLPCALGAIGGCRPVHSDTGELLGWVLPDGLPAQLVADVMSGTEHLSENQPKQR